jgi:Tfp pilus assembly protein PilZ
MSGALRIRQTVLLPLRDRATFLDHYFKQSGIGGVFVPGYLKLTSAEEVDLEIAFAREQVTMHARGIIRWKRLTDKKILPAGIGVEFLDSERRTRDLLIDFARGRSVKLARRRSRRYPAMLEIEYSHNSVFLTDVTDDLSRDGASIITNHVVEVGEIVQMKLKPTDEFPTIAVKGEVRWQQSEGRKGFGVRFIFEEPGTEERLRELIEQIKRLQAKALGAARV